MATTMIRAEPSMPAFCRSAQPPDTLTPRAVRHPPPLIWIDLSTVVLMVTFFCVSVYRFSKALVQDMGSDSRRWITLICVGWLPTGLHFVTELPFSLFVGHPHSGGATKGDLGFSSPATHTLNQSLCFAVFMPAPCCDVPCLSPHRQSPR